MKTIRNMLIADNPAESASTNAKPLRKDNKDNRQQKAEKRHLNKYPAAFRCHTANCLDFKSQHIPIAVNMESAIISMQSKHKGDTMVVYEKALFTNYARLRRRTKPFGKQNRN